MALNGIWNYLPLARKILTVNESARFTALLETFKLLYATCHLKEVFLLCWAMSACKIELQLATHRIAKSLKNEDLWLLVCGQAREPQPWLLELDGIPLPKQLSQNNQDHNPANLF